MKKLFWIVAAIVLSIAILIQTPALAQTTATDEIQLATIVTPAPMVVSVSTVPAFPSVTNDVAGRYRSTYGPRFEIKLHVDTGMIEERLRVTVNSLRGESTVNAFTYADPETGMLTISFTEADHWKYLLRYTPQDGGMFFGTLTNPTEEWTVRFNKI